MVLADQELMQANDLALFLDISAKEILVSTPVSSVTVSPVWV